MKSRFILYRRCGVYYYEDTVMVPHHLFVALRPVLPSDGSAGTFPRSNSAPPQISKPAASRPAKVGPDFSSRRQKSPVTNPPPSVGCRGASGSTPATSAQFHGKCSPSGGRDRRRCPWSSIAVILYVGLSGKKVQRRLSKWTFTFQNRPRMLAVVQTEFRYRGCRHRIHPAFRQALPILETGCKPTANSATWWPAV